MAKRKIPRKDLKNLKESFKQEKMAQNSQELGVYAAPAPMKDKIAAAKAAGRDFKLNETGKTTAERKKELKEKKSQIKQDFSGTQVVTTSYGFKEGDIVKFHYGKDEEVGLVFKIRVRRKTNQDTALNEDRVEILSSAGYVTVIPKTIFEIIECN